MTLILAALTSLNIWIQSPFFGICLVIILLFFLNFRRHNIQQTILVSLAWFAVMGSFFYYTYKLNNFTIFLTLLSLPLPFRFIKAENTAPIAASPKKSSQTDALALLLGVAANYLVWQGRTDHAIVSPWPEIPNTFFILLFLLLALYFFSP